MPVLDDHEVGGNLKVGVGDGVAVEPQIEELAPVDHKRLADLDLLRQVDLLAVLHRVEGGLQVVIPSNDGAVSVLDARDRRTGCMRLLASPHKQRGENRHSCHQQVESHARNRFYLHYEHPFADA